MKAAVITAIFDPTLHTFKPHLAFLLTIETNDVHYILTTLFFSSFFGEPTTKKYIALSYLLFMLSNVISQKCNSFIILFYTFYD